MEISSISESFRKFAENECRGSSSLYEQLSGRIAGDDDLLRIAAASREGQPIPNLLLGAVHLLLLSGFEHELIDYYGSIVPNPKDAAAAFVPFKHFCLLYRDELAQLLATKLVQTNEVRRCAYLYPAFCLIHRLSNKPLALIEVGTSAGLQLFWDQYRYSYDSVDGYFGNQQSSFTLATSLRGSNMPFLYSDSPPVASRMGIDLHVNQLQDPEDRLWMKALIWPEHRERMEHFEVAASAFDHQAVQLIEGNALACLDSAAATITEDHALCVFHTHVANQLSLADKQQLCEQIRIIGETREVYHLYNNMWDPELHLDSYRNGRFGSVTLAETDGHARWLNWKL
ncbi:DUF2332 domain-containing protein [Paenibacillus lignilyticus]|uniref:DUF2332 domain-containing protein n=1 Tax=Paenibacillus lignilyticus TaxID=1172615 RepID=A0ABS5CES8_9BACL|nr:DUF2332 domain-containing protein [Paenibacillus lignilyticus]MBP3963943.1 DUF2332 domain-containing protein [Paenibacillus lignilyticus]